MAGTGRFVRRALAEAFISFYEKAVPGQRGTRLYIEPFSSDTAYLFMQLPFSGMGVSYERYREIRRCMLQDYCLINKFLNPELVKVIGIACKTRDGLHGISPAFFGEGQDFVFMDFSEFSAEDMAGAEALHKEYVLNGILVDRTEFRGVLNEFPDVSVGDCSNADIKGRDRNRPCQCGSGKKVKKCCGRA